MPKLDLKNMIGYVELDGVTWYQHKDRGTLFIALVDSSLVFKQMWLDNGYVIHKTGGGYEAVEILPMSDIDDEESRLGLRNALDHLVSGQDVLVTQLNRLEDLLLAPALCSYLIDSELGVKNTTHFMSSMGDALYDVGDDLKCMLNTLEMTLTV